jgi:hypothetical protein
MIRSRINQVLWRCNDLHRLGLRYSSNVRKIGFLGTCVFGGLMGLSVIGSKFAGLYLKPYSRNSFLSALYILRIFFLHLLQSSLTVALDGN